MEILRLADTPIKTIISKTIDVLASGGLVIFPTETTYGAGVDATHPQAVEKLLSYKSRREGKPLSIAVTSQEMAGKYVVLNEQAVALYKQFLPGPVTVVSKSKDTVAPGVASEFGTVGVRIPDYPLLLEILASYSKPITATSANGSGQKRPYSITDIFENISEKQKSLIDLVLDAGTLPPNPPSTVIDTTLSTPVTLREGSITVENSSTNTHVLYSQSEAETKSIAGRLVLKHWDNVGKTGLVIGLEGPLGAGKTVFAKGVAEFLQLSEQLTSPTYTYIEEYPFTRHSTQGNFYHLDMWKVDTAAVFEKLELERILLPRNVFVIEWWSQVAAFCKPLLQEHSIPLLTIDITEEKATNPAANSTDRNIHKRIISIKEAA